MSSETMRSLLIVLAVVSGCWATGNSNGTSNGCSAPDLHRCTNGECIHIQQVCDFHKDCSDGSDEIHCEEMANNCMPPMWWACENGDCISSLFRCDLMLHCLDESDEKNCNGKQHPGESISCTQNQFRCDHTCIPKDMVCNGEPDCLDESDEINCSSGKNSTTPHCNGFTCANGHCIYDGFVCDGVNDCKDNSDEANCTAKLVNEDCNLNEGFFPCKDNKTCITAESVCDGVKNCNDNSDEGGVCTNPNKNCIKANCSHGCINTPTGPFCICPNGYGRTSNVTCEDLDECHLLHSHCSQHCKNTPGSFYCTCDEGYTLQSNNRTCKADGPDPLIIFATNHHIMGYLEKHRKYFPIIQSPIKTIGVACDDSFLYFTSIEYGYEGITKAYRNGTHPQVIVKNGLKAPEDISIDWYTGNIYFTDSEMKHIGVCTNDGMHCASLISKNIQKPRAIVLNPYKGEMYWTDWGESPEIAKAKMDGSDDVSLVIKDITWPNGLAADYPNERLYWVDGKHSTIESIKFDGSFRQKILRNINHPYWIAVFEDKIYWTDWGTNSLETCNKFTGKDRKILLKLDQVNGLHIYHPTMAPKKNHSCLNHECEYICLLKGETGYTCGCPEGHILRPDKKTCRSVIQEKYLLVGTANTLMLIHHQVLGGHKSVSVEYPDLHIDALVHDSLKDEIIIYDDYSKTIYSIKSYMSDQRTKTILLDSDIGHIQGLDLDCISRTLYWCDTTRRTVEVLSLETRSRAVLMTSPEDGLYVDVAVVPDSSVMFLALCKYDDEVILTKIGMDGKGTPVHVIEHGLLGPMVKLNYDVSSSQILISDQTGENIQSVSVKGSARHSIHQVNMKIGSLTSLDDEIFWFKRKSKTLRWVRTSEDLKITRHYKLDIPFKVNQVHVTAVDWHGKLSNSNRECSQSNNFCSHICVLSVSGPQTFAKKNGTISVSSHLCLCPLGSVLHSDGKTCLPEVSCDLNHFKCRKSNVCVDQSRLCDKKTDCAFGEDEEGCSEIKTECSESQFQCRNGVCIDRASRCNKIKDCSDNSDEENCNHYDPNLHCVKTEFKCESGMCLDLTLRCDGKKDCPDGDDENHCNTYVCSQNYFQCQMGNCIPKTWECDSKTDCEDGSDEHNKCSYNKPCKSGMYKCRSGNCIDSRLYCDTNEDCDDGSDELDCPVDTVKECQDNEYACETNQTICLPYTAKCNGSHECPMGEDEFDCEILKCEPSQWKCATSNQCIESHWKCDSSADCLDKSDEDEKMCKDLKDNHLPNHFYGIHELVSNISSTHSIYGCRGGYRCHSGECLDYADVCDGISNCYDGSDENGMCHSACKVKTQCSEICVPTPQGAVCKCGEKREIASDGINCVPSSSVCLQNPPPCHHRCTETDDSHVCSCFEGFSLTSDRRSCKAFGEPKSILYMNSAQLRKLYSRDSTIKILHKSNSSQLTSMDVYVAKDSVFFTIESLGQIRHLNFMTQKEIIISDVGKPSLIAVDWVAENVYFINNDSKKNIMVCHMDRQKCAKLLDLDNDMITAFTIDPINKLMFYASTSSYKSSVYKVNLDGTDLVEMVKDGLNHCSGLTADYERKLLYFADDQTNKIESYNYEMTHRNVVFEKNPHVTKPRGLDIFEDEIYFLIPATTKLMKCQLYDMKSCTPINLRMFGIETFKIDQQSKQKNGLDVCSTKNCTHLCVQGKQFGQCLCDDGRKVDDNVECGNIEKPPKFVDGRRLASDNVIQVAKNPSGTALSAIIITVAIVVLVLGAILIYKHQKKRLNKASKLDYSSSGKRRKLINEDAPTFEMSTFRIPDIAEFSQTSHWV